MAKYAFTDNFLKNLLADQQRKIEDKIISIGLPNSTMEERLDSWFVNFRDQKEKEIALNIFFEIDYFSEYRIEKLLSIYKIKLCQYLVDKGKDITDVIVVTPEGKADSADSHAYKLSKEWNLPREIFLSTSDVSQESSSGKVLLFFNDTHGSGSQFVREFSHVIKHAGGSNCFIFCYAITEKALLLFNNEFPNITIVPELSTPTIYEKSKFTQRQLQLIQSLGAKVYPPHSMGYGNCGLLAAYHFQCPNNNLPIVWANGNNNSYINADGHKVDG